jgi:N-acetylglutamate synthase-like GNAT family acetyltransferase
LLRFSNGQSTDAQAASRVDEGIDSHNTAQPTLAHVKPLQVFVRDENDAVVGGAVGRTWGRCAELQQLWVHPDIRKKGIATELLRRFEDAARTRGVATVYLETFTFQAPGFYKRCGYAVALTIEGFEPDVQKFTMIKALSR